MVIDESISDEPPKLELVKKNIFFIGHPENMTHPSIIKLWKSLRNAVSHIVVDENKMNKMVR